MGVPTHKQAEGVASRLVVHLQALQLVRSQSAVEPVVEHYLSNSVAPRSRFDVGPPMPLPELLRILRVHPQGGLSQTFRNPPRVRPSDVVVVVPLAYHQPTPIRQVLTDALQKRSSVPILVHQGVIGFVGMH
jgi:hypothetical protein